MILLKNLDQDIEIFIEPKTKLADHIGKTDGLPKFKCCKGLCGLCLIELTTGADMHPILNDQEVKKIGNLGKTPGRYRLACQLVVNYPIEFRPVF